MSNLQCALIGLIIFLSAAVPNAQTALYGEAPQRNGEAPQRVESRSAQQIGALFAASCATCHVASDSGAPQIGAVADWRPRVQKGRAQLLRNTVDGYLDMPPLGACGACTLADFRTLIDLLIPSDAWDAAPERAEAR